MPRRRRSRVYWRKGRAWGDFRDFADVGGKLQRLVPRGEEYATTDPDVADKLATDLVTEFEQRRRNRTLLRVERQTTLGAYASEHLVAKAESGNFVRPWLATVEKHLRVAIEFFGSDRELATITPRDVQRFVAWLQRQPGRKGTGLSAGTVRHHLNSLSNLYRRAASEGYVEVGFNPVAALIEKPSAARNEAEFLEVDEAALMLEAARTFRSAPGPFAQAVLDLVTDGPWQGTPAEFLETIEAHRPRVRTVPGGWPTAARGLSAHLTRIKPLLRARGIAIERETHGWKPTIRVLRRSDGDQPSDPAASDMLPFMYTLLATFLLTGGRRSEVLGLRVEDLSFDRKTVTFRPHDLRRLKTSTSHRVVPMWPQLEEILRQYVYGGESPRVSGLLFPGKDGEMVVELRRPLDAIAMRAGWAEGEIRCHRFRHTYCAARLQTLDGGAPVSPFTVARELGHGGDALVKRIYGHLGQVRHRSNVVEYRVEQHAERLGERLRALAAHDPRSRSEV